MHVEAAAADRPEAQQVAAEESGNELSREQLLQLYEKMVLVRRLEQALGQHHQLGHIRGPIHRCDGQEAVGIGVTAALRPDDVVTSTHRGHAHYIGKGANLRSLAAEIFGRRTGYCRGRAGHMLVADASIGLLGGNGIVGGAIPVATGMALAFQLQKQNRVAVCFFGEGAAQIGAFHESLNVAGLWKLPVVYVCEHNQYGLTVAARFQSSVPDIAARAASYGMPGVLVDGNDVEKVYRVAQEAVRRARLGGGPTLIEAKTYRLTGFSTSDLGGYQPPEEIRAWQERDPIQRLRNRLVGLLGAPDAVEAAEQRATAAVQEAIEFALQSPLPSVDELQEPIYAQG